MLIRKNYYSKRRYQIKEMVLEILVHLDQMVMKMSNYLSNPEDKTKEEIQTIEEQINSYENKIEKYILEIVSVVQLDTSEIKWIFSMSRIIRELERVGDQVINVLTVCHVLDTLELQESVNKFFEHELKMIQYLSEGIENDDIKKIEATISHDNYVNYLEEKTISNMISVINKGDAFTEGNLKMVMVSRFLERIGDHLANTAKAYQRTLY